MYKITNPKIGFKRFCGFSLLFDNPSKSLSPVGCNRDLFKINLGFSNAPKKTIYKTLKTVMEEISFQISDQDNLIFNLPLSSFHVTVWDG